MTKVQIQKVVPERQFVELLQNHSESFFLLSNALTHEQAGRWNRKHFFSLISETDSLESFLDDYGARFNRTYAPFTGLVASVRWFAKAGYSLAHHLGRLNSYGAGQALGDGVALEALKSTQHASVFTQDVARMLLAEIVEEARSLGLRIPKGSLPEGHFPPVSVRVQLPRNVGQLDPQNEQQKIVEVASKYLQTCEMLNELGVRVIDNSKDRASFLDRCCTEEKARVYQAAVHNLQSAYDTYIRNTVLESEDDRLPQLRGHCSAALHLLEAVTHLTHFIERHDGDDRSAESRDRIQDLVDRDAVQAVILNNLLVWANRYLQGGAAAAGELLPAYTNVTELDVTLPADVSLHARPVALIVSIVAHHGMPIEMEIGGQTENAASILKLLMMVGSHPDERHFVFRGAEDVLKDIELLFDGGLGERGLDTLPNELDYLRER